MTSGMDKETGVGVLELEHINLAVPQNSGNAARTFYGELLGLEELPKPETLRANKGYWFKLGTVTLHLAEEAAFVPAKKAHPAFLVRDLEVARARFTAFGVEVRPDTRAPQVRRFYVDDPFGNRLEFIQAGDTFQRTS